MAGIGIERMKTLLVKGAFWAAAAFLVWILGRYVLVWFSPFALGFLIAYLIRPVARFVEKHSGMSARGASIVSAAVFYAAAGGLLWMLGLWLFWQMQKLGAWFPELYETTVRPFLEELDEMISGASAGSYFGAGTSSLIVMANEALGSAAASASRWGLELMGGFAKKIPMFIITLVFTILSSVLICMDYGKVAETVLRRVPKRWRGELLETRDFLLRSIGKALGAYLIIMFITFCLLAVGLWLLGAGGFLAMAALIAFLDLLPVLGSGVILIPWAAYCMLSGQVGLGWGLLGVWAAISVIRETLEPRILGGQIGMNSLLTLTAMYAGLRVAGVAGLLLAPVFCLLLRRLSDKGVIPKW